MPLGAQHCAGALRGLNEKYGSCSGAGPLLVQSFVS